MKNPLRFAVCICALLLSTGIARAQTPAPEEARPATTTFTGDTGLWFVPTAEVLASGSWSVSGYRRGTNFVQGFTNVGDFAGTFAVGLGGRAELFGSFLFVTRIDRDLRPLFVDDPEVGGVLDRYPNVALPWTGNNPGDFYAGLKFSLLSASRDDPMALAVRAMVKAPAGDSDIGNSTGKTDFLVDLIASRETLAHTVEYSGFVGYEFRGEPDGYDAPSGAFRWGAGLGIPARGPLRGVVEVSGVLPNADTLNLGDAVLACPGCVVPFASNVEKTTRATLALTWQHSNGFFIGGGLGMNLPRESRDDFETQDSPLGDFTDWQVRIGFHPGVRRSPAEIARLTPPPPPPAPAAPEPVNRPPTITARCEPCQVEVGQPSTVTAEGQDPDGDVLTYRWSGPSGAFQNPADRQTVWTAPQQEGAVPLTVTADDGKGGTASAQVTIQVTRPPIVELVFEDVYFDFDRSSLRSEAQRILDDAATKLQANPDRRVVIEGHTCNIGTAEYNLALGERRATSVRDYLVSLGVAASRIEVRSYGEEQPKHDNSREETRRLNRRAALVVSVE